MLVEISVCKVDKFGVSPGGDTVEVTERPTGGVSVVLSDGQGSGPPAKAISSLVVSKAISLIADGARDGAVARAVHDALYARRRGQVSATLTMISADTDHDELVISRNSNCPVLLFEADGRREVLDEETYPIGTQRMIKPHIVQLPLKVPRTVLAFSDGILNAGRGSGRQVSVAEIVEQGSSLTGEPAEAICGGMLDWVLDRDDGRPGDDVSVIVLKVTPRVQERDVRELSVKYPL